MRVRRLLFLCVGGLLSMLGATTVLGAPPLDGPITAEAILTHKAINVGDQIGLRVRVTHPASTPVTFPQLYDQLGDLEVVSAKQLPITRFPDGTQVSTMEYIITGFLPGEYQVPPITVSYGAAQGQQETVTTSEPLGVQVVSLLEANPNVQFQDIKPPLSIPSAPLSYAPLIAQLALVMGVAGLVLMLIRRWPRRHEVRRAPAAALAADAIAREELARIAGLGLLEQEAYTTYYSLISTCIRRYLDERYELEALGATTQELQRIMEVRELDRWHIRIIAGLLEECDAAKWAHYEPLHARGDRAMTIALEIVALTAPREEPEPVAQLAGLAQS